MRQTEVIDEIECRMQKYPDFEYRRSESRIVVLPQNEKGFTVSLALNGAGYTPLFDGWHEEFEDAETVLSGFAFGLSEECRLEVVSRGRFPYIWTVQQCDENGEWDHCDWLGLPTTGMLVFPFWLHKSMRYL